jgi:hypothetical protein
MFPNRGNVVAGTLRLFEQDGGARDDAADIAIFLERVGARPEPRPRPPQISQRGRRFDPAVLVVTRGTTVRFPNDDVVFHNVFSLSRGNAFDLGTYGKGHERQHTFTTPGLAKIHCNIHPDMASHILVVDSAQHAVTAADGSWVIGDVPDGDWVLRVWHALAEEQRHDVRVAGGEIRTVPLVVRETRPRVQHRDKNGRAYRRRY